MIIRILEGSVPAVRVAAAHRQVRRAVAEASRARGCIRAYAGRQVMSDLSERLTMFTVWASLEDLYGWLGVADLLDTALHGEDPQLFSQFRVEHYEALEIGSDGWLTISDVSVEESA